MTPRILSFVTAFAVLAAHPSAGRGAQPTQAPPIALALPQIDETSLLPERRALWIAVQAKWTIVSARVHEARVLLDELSLRLDEWGLALNARDASTAVRMEQSLAQSRELIVALEFERAAEALRRTDYERTKLKHVTGQ